MRAARVVSNRDLLAIIMIPGRPVPAQRMLQKAEWGTPRRDHLVRYARYRERVAHYARLAYSRRPFQGDVGVRLTHYAPRSTRADLDNVTKPVLDGISGVVINDDASVVHLEVDLVPIGNAQDERVEIEVWRWQVGAARPRLYAAGP